jgi:hypothetical protein
MTAPRPSKTVVHPGGESENFFTGQDPIGKLTNMALWLGVQQSQIDKLPGTIPSLKKLENI